MLNPILQAKIGINNLNVNDQYVGDVTFHSIWHGTDKRINLLLSNQRADTLTFLAKGNYYTDNGSLNFDVNINKAKLSFIAPYFKEVFRTFRGL